MSFLYHINVIQGYKEVDWCRHRPFMIETIFYGQIQIFVAFYIKFIFMRSLNIPCGRSEWCVDSA